MDRKRVLRPFLTADLTIRLRSKETALQISKSKRSEAKLHMDPLRRNPQERGIPGSENSPKLVLQLEALKGVLARNPNALMEQVRF